MESIVKIVNGLAEVLGALTASRVGLLLILGLGGVFIDAVYENRQQLLAELLASPFFLIGGGIGLFLLSLGLIFKVLLNKYEKGQGEIDELRMKKIEELKADVEYARKREAETMAKYDSLVERLGDRK